MADSLTEFLGLLAHSKECKGLSRCWSHKGVVGRHDIGMDLLDHVGATLGQKAPELLKFLTRRRALSTSSAEGSARCGLV